MKLLVLMLLIACMVYVGWDYGRLILRCKHLQENDNYTPDIDPSRFIFVQGNSGIAKKWFETWYDSHSTAGIRLLRTFYRGNVKIYVFENNDEAWIFNYQDAQMLDRLAPDLIECYKHKMFFDKDLPKEAIGKIIEGMGFEGYLVPVGICKGDDENAI